MYMQKTDWWTNRVCLSIFYVLQITSSWWRQQLFVLETNKDKEKEEVEKFMRQLCTHITYLNPFTMPRFNVPTGTGWHLSRFIQMIWQIKVKNPIYFHDLCLHVTLYDLLYTKALTIQCQIKPVHRCGTIDHHPVHVYKLYYRKSTLKHQRNTKMYLLRRCNVRLWIHYL